MLIDFKVRNFLSYKDNTRLLMTPVKSFKEHSKTHLINTSKGLDLLKTSAIYGSNGGGKSNFITAFGVFKKIVHNSFSDSLKSDEDRGATDYYFKLNSQNEQQPTLFQSTFLIDGIIYRYGFEIKGFEIVSEWLFKKNESETKLFSRNSEEFYINASGFPEGKKYKDEVNSNVLFLSHLAQHNSKEASKVYSWFKITNAVSGLYNDHYESFTRTLLGESEKFRHWLSLAVRFLEITKVDTGTHNDDIFTYHNKFDENNTVIDSVAFRVANEESEGTRKLIYLLGAIYDTLIGGKVLFVDELDNKLHPNLSKKLLEFFHTLNNKGAQFIFTAHDASLLDKKLLRRDQIWFVDKDQFGASDLYPMSEFSSDVVRSASDYRKKYLESVFGAAETIEITNDLKSLLDE